jgi:hypothetical protein
LDTVQILNDLKAERKRIDDAIAALEALGSDSPAQTAAPAPAKRKYTRRAVVESAAPAKKGKRHMSEEGRRRIAEAARRRWAAQKKGKA